ncbi:MAG: flagellar motor protein MotB [Pseudomonadota bacterium]
MAGSALQQNVVIIKKKVVKGHGGHHGGAWKVAYADFVTAMMAFFLLMWLINATTEEQRKGLADYFNPSIPISKVSGGGQGALNGSSILSEDTLIRDEIGASDEFPAARPETATPDEEVEAPLDTLREKIEIAKQDTAVSELAAHINTRMTPEGLLIELVDVDDDPLFSNGSAQPSRVLKNLLYAIAPVLSTVSNKMAITGHTDATSFSTSANYSNWELSTDRAHASRRLLVEYGFPITQVAEVAGKASNEPLSDDPSAPQNRRIAITLLREI